MTEGEATVAFVNVGLSSTSVLLTMFKALFVCVCLHECLLGVLQQSDQFKSNFI